MAEFSLGYREVFPDQALYEKWKDITLTTGGTQSTLQDIKVTEKANGYSFRDSTKHYTRNRFIYWKINYDVLELVEHSLGINLADNRLRYRFTDSPVLDGVSIQETNEFVVILVPTVCSVHRLTFPHPSRFHRQDELLGTHPHLAAPSIFAKTTASDARNPKSFHVFINPNTAINQLPSMASSYYDKETEESIFILAYPGSELLLVKQNAQGQTATTELKGESLMPRFISGITEKFRGKNGDSGYIVSVLIHVIDYEPFVLTLYRSGHLKFWSCTKAQCVTEVDILAEAGDFEKDRLQNAMIRKTVDSQETDGNLGIFMSFSSGCQFHVFKPTLHSQQIKIRKINTLASLENDIIDFSLQLNRLWSVWRTSDDDCIIYTASLRTGKWTPVIKEKIHDSPGPVENSQSDPKQVYLEHLFRPGRFPLHIVGKSLGIYKKSSLISSDPNLSSVAALKQNICLAIENDIQNCFKDRDYNDEEYLDYAEWCWQKFYSVCVQYHRASLRPLGLVLLPQSCGAVLLKKATFSFLRPMEPLEHMVLCSDYMYKDQFVNFALLGEEAETIEDVMSLFEVMVYLDDQLSEDFKTAFEKELATSLMPNIAMLKLIEKLKTETEGEYNNICQQIFNLLTKCLDLYRAMHKILELLRQDSVGVHPDKESNPVAMHFFNSCLGVSFVSSCLRQQSQNRFAICRNLLLVCEILIGTKELTPGVFEAVHSVCKPEIVYLTQASYVMLWLTSLPALNNVPSETTLQRLSSLKLTPAFNSRPNGSCFSLLELFTASTGGREARKMFAKTDFNGKSVAHWHLSLLPFISHLRHILWPLKNGTALVEWLVSSGQHVWLQQYVRILSSWCDWNISSSSFLLAVSFLTSGENYKALDLFQMAVKGVKNEPFLQDRLAKKGGDAFVNYYLKVIQLFELHKARDCAISMANTALSLIEEDNPLLPTLFSIKFKHHLALRHYEEAYYALKANPDHERKKDNLRDLVKTLLDEKQFDILLSFTYGDMDEFFTNILLTRARATDALNNVFYEFLYAYQIKRGPLCHRLAASVMYEQAFRLSQRDSAEVLEKQVKCYLAAKNVLQLCDPQYAWVVRPSDPDETEQEIVLESKAGSRQDNEVFRIKRQVEVVNVNDIKKELTFACAKLKLIRFDTNGLLNVTTPIELVTLLSSSGLFKSALEVCSTFELSYAPVFEALTWRCVMLSEEENPSAWEWLVENDLQDLPANRDSISEVVWQLLQDYLERYERPGMTTLHKVICKKVISLRMYIPFWLLVSYKLRNPSELLKLLHCSGRLDEAFEVAHEYLLAAMGYGKELYGFKTGLAPTSPAFCMPVYALKCLITELEMQNQKNLERPFEKEQAILEDLFKRYLETAMRISNEKCQHLTPSFGSIQSSQSSGMVF